jgi:hypothetical protein
MNHRCECSSARSSPKLRYPAIEAADGASALSVLRSDARIDVTDVGLSGGMNGRQSRGARTDGASRSESAVHHFMQRRPRLAPPDSSREWRSSQNPSPWTVSRRASRSLSTDLGVRLRGHINSSLGRRPCGCNVQQSIELRPRLSTACGAWKVRRLAPGMPRACQPT